jgi:hypothetical protein
MTKLLFHKRKNTIVVVTTVKKVNICASGYNPVRTYALLYDTQISSVYLSSVAATIASPTKKNTRVQRKVPCPIAVIATLFKDCGYFLCKDGILKCYCDNRSKAKMDMYELKKHHENKKHVASKDKRVQDQQAATEYGIGC